MERGKVKEIKAEKNMGQSKRQGTSQEKDRIRCLLPFSGQCQKQISQAAESKSGDKEGKVRSLVRKEEGKERKKDCPEAEKHFSGRVPHIGFIHAHFYYSTLFIK